MPLSVTIVLGTPNLANTERRQSITTVDVAFLVGKDSIYFECASSMTKNIRFSKGHAKSRCSLDHGLLGHFHGLSGASGGDERTS